MRGDIVKRQSPEIGTSASAWRRSVCRPLGDGPASHRPGGGGAVCQPWVRSGDG